ncbi:hypothetical protein [Flagellimonas onchidii]|uniref:hypothetical protein n=1 Tax=Flagellimonas onchidii TaxID=2562684 RepID=UPI0010A6400B|nr:hypothetical protein [Allomuricauda onchidii]
MKTLYKAKNIDDSQDMKKRNKIILTILVLPILVSAQLRNNVNLVATLEPPKGDELHFGNLTAISGDGNTIVVYGRGIQYNTSIDLKGNSEKVNMKMRGAGVLVTYKMVRGKPLRIRQLLRGNVPNEFFGNKVSLSFDGKTMAVGSTMAYFIKNSESDHMNGAMYSSDGCGKVNVYSFDDENQIWVPKGQELHGKIYGGTQVNTGNIYLPRVISGEGFGQVAISDDGNILAVGTPGHSKGKGLVKTYRFNGIGWNLMHEIQSPLPDKSYRFGVRLALSGNGKRLVTAFRATAENFFMVYDLENERWTRKVAGIGKGNSEFDFVVSKKGKFISAGEKLYKIGANKKIELVDDFGENKNIVKISVDGTKLIVLDRKKQTGNNSPGVVYFYKKSENGYRQNVNMVYEGDVISANEGCSYFLLSSKNLGQFGPPLRLYKVAANFEMFNGPIEIIVLPAKND